MKIIPQHNILLKLNIFKNLIEYKDARYPDSIFYHKNDKIYFELDMKNNILWCDIDLVWNIFSNQNTLKYNETQRVIKDMVETYTNWVPVTPMNFPLAITCVVETYTNWVPVTPEQVRLNKV